MSKGLAVAQSVIPQLSVRTREISSPPHNLLDAVPSPSGIVAWLSDDVSIVGWGEAVKLEFSGPHAMREAGKIWAQVAGKATVESYENEGEEAPLTWPLALASFGFASQSSGYLIVPAYALVQANGRTWAATAAADAPAPNPLDVLPEDEARVSVPAGLWTEPGRMTQTKWKDTVRRLARMLQSGAASKVVLTRDIVVSASAPLDERFLLRELRERYPSTWVYAVAGLVGATPEMLASLHRERFVSRVLAGTSEPGEGHTLLESAKNRTEHHLAVESVARALATLAEEMTVPSSPELLDLPNVTHLATEVEAVVRGFNVLDIVDALHPTAAVCGTPTRLAFDILENLEGTQRGRYTGPVGWIDGSGDGEFGIALRCGQLSDDHTQIRVFAGGGIMPDSVPELELAETRAKMRPVLEALGIEK